MSKCAYTKTQEKARGGIEKREYWQTDDIGWLSRRKDWAGLRSIAATRNTIMKAGKETSETRYFISSLPVDAKEVSRAIRGHWMVESHHWHLDVTFREDGNHTLEKQAAFTLPEGFGPNLFHPFGVAGGQSLLDGSWKIKYPCKYRWNVLP